MKKLFLLIILFSTFSYSQIPPQGISHRGTVYNTSGVVVPNTSVKIRISILDESNTGSVVYSETHTVLTNAQGQYSLNIGTSTILNPPNIAFNLINWATNLKFLKVEIDLPTSPNVFLGTFPIVGSNQLMSVPYALYSGNTANGIITIEDIASLRARIGKIGEVVYIKKHTFPNDGGEGFFFWRENIPANDIRCNDNNGTIIRASNSVGGAWIRSIEDRINVNFFGTFGASQLTDGEKIQKAIDFAYNNQFQWGYTNAGTTVYIPTGRYVIKDKLILKSGVSIEGENINNTLIVANNDTKKDGAMIEMDSGQIIGVNISNLTLLGDVPADPGSPTTITKHCFYLEAKIGPANDGGLWTSTFKNLRIVGFNGSGIILKGGGFDNLNYQLPNQDLVFQNVGVVRQRHASDCLLIQGEAGQLTFINCGFDGLKYGTDTTKFFNVAIETNQVQPAVIKFLTCTFQQSEYGVITTYAESVTFDNCWFENLDIGVAATKSAGSSNPPIGQAASKCINIINSRFANAAGFGTLNITNKNLTGGTCISVEGGSNVNVLNNYVLTSDVNFTNSNNYFIRNNALDSKINASNNSFQNQFLGRTFGIANKTINITGNILSTYGYKFITVNCLPTANTTTNIKEINSEISGGEMITIRATGTTGQIKFDNSRNIVFAKTTVTPTTPFVLNPNETATFMKTDIGVGPINGVYYSETYQLISVNKTY